VAGGAVLPGKGPDGSAVLQLQATSGASTYRLATLIGGVAGVVGLVVLPVVRRRYAAGELRRIAALDVGRRS
jgi:hypothetical protein